MYPVKTLKGIYKRVIGAMSGFSDINVAIQKDVCPNFNCLTRTVTMPPKVSFADTEQEAFEFGRGICVHESGHVLFAPKRTKAQLKQPKDYHEWVNVFADINNEYKVAELFPNLKKPLIDKSEALIKKFPEIAKSDNPMMQVLIRCDKLANLNPEYPEEYPTYLQEFVEDIVAEHDRRKTYEATGEEMMKFVDEVYEKWKGLKDLVKDKRGKIDQLMKDLGDSINAGDTQKEDDINDKIDEITKQTAWFKDEVDRRALREVDSEGDMSEITLDKLKEMLKKQTEDSMKFGSGKKGVISNAPGVGFIDPLDEFEVKELDLSEAYKDGKKTAQKIKRKVFEVKTNEGRQRSGRIDVSEIQRQVSKAGRLTSSNIFERNTRNTEGCKWSVSLLIDCSGSMYEARMEEAQTALATLGYCLDSLAGVTYEINGYVSSCAHNVEFYTVKTFKQKKLNVERLKCLNGCGGTPTGEAMDYTARKLEVMPHKRLMIVITDGQPESEDKVKKAVAYARVKGIKILGIAIGDVDEYSFNDMFKNFYNFSKSENISSDISRLVIKTINGGK